VGRRGLTKFFGGTLALSVSAILALGMVVAGAQPLSAPDPVGVWLVAKRVAEIRIVDCNGALWGVVAWETTPGIDSKNPDTGLKNRPTLGMPILLGMTRTNANRWDGQIYNSQDGHVYSANISLVNPDVLRVRGCFLGFLCGGEDWTRVPPPQAGVAPMPAPPNAREPARRHPPPPPPSETDADVCLRLLGPPGLPHQGGLK